MEKDIMRISEDLFTALAENEAETNLVLRANLAAEIIKPAIIQVYALTKDSASREMEEQVHLNKDLLPPILAEHYYYTGLHNIEVNKPVGSAVKPYYEKQQVIIESFFACHHPFIRYCRSGNTEWDQSYFGNQPVHNGLFLDESLPESKSISLNPWTLLLARSIAYERLLCFIMNTLNMLDGKHFIDRETLPGMEWTGSKTDLVELVYAFYAAGVFDNGKSTITELIRYIEKLFGINLGNTSMTFQEILRRKQSTAFLDKLKDKLETHMTRIEEKQRR